MGGKVALLWQPFEAVIIVGAAIGSFIIGNTASVVKATGSAINKSLKGTKYSKDNYVERISLLYQILKVAKTKGNLGLEKHIEHPPDSELCNQLPGVLDNETAITCMCDNLPKMNHGNNDTHDMKTQ